MLQALLPERRGGAQFVDPLRSPLQRLPQALDLARELGDVLVGGDELAVGATAGRLRRRRPRLAPPPVVAYGLASRASEAWLLSGLWDLWGLASGASGAHGLNGSHDPSHHGAEPPFCNVSTYHFFPKKGSAMPCSLER